MQKTEENKSIVNKDDLAKNLYKLSFSEKDSLSAFLCKKIEKLAAALYLVSGLMSDEEPIKWKLRDNGMNFLHYGVSLINEPLSEGNSLDKISGSVFHTLSLLEVSFVSAMISEMNFSILKREFEVVIRTIGSRVPKGSMRSLLLTESFFSVMNNPGEFENKDKISPDYLSAGSGKEKQDSRTETAAGDDVVKSDEAISKGHYKGHLSIKDNKGHKEINQTTSKIDGKRLFREKVILDFLKKKNDLSIIDLRSIIKNCSSKTIQRELNYLVVNGVLKKSGQRRWSRYSLAL